jgi:hypothetical protein
MRGQGRSIQAVIEALAGHGIEITDDAIRLVPKKGR